MRKILFLFLLATSSLWGAGTWTSTVDLSATGFDASEPQIVMNDAGQTVVVWARNARVQACTLAFGGSWSAPVDLSASGDTATQPKLAINASGQVVAIWKKVNGSNQEIESATLTFGGSWSAVVSIESGTELVGCPSVALNASGEAVALWCRSDGSNLLIESSELNFGGSWSTPVVLSDTGFDAMNPSLAFNDAHQAVAVWIRNDVIQARTTSFGVAWGSVVNLSKKTGVTVPFVVLDESGDVRISWTRVLSGITYYEMGAFSFGGSWTTPIFLTTTETPLDYVNLIFNPIGAAIALWPKTVYGYEVIFALIYEYTKWAAPAMLSALGQNASSPTGVINSPGQMVAIWLRSNGASVIVQASTNSI